MPASHPLVVLKHVDFVCNGQPVLEQVSFSIIPNDFIAVIGPNDGDKRTLLKLILGLLKPNCCTIRVNDGYPQKAVTNIGYIPQNVHVNTNSPITAMDVVLMGTLNLTPNMSNPLPL